LVLIAHTNIRRLFKMVFLFTKTVITALVLLVSLSWRTAAAVHASSSVATTTIPKNKEKSAQQDSPCFRVRRQEWRHDAGTVGTFFDREKGFYEVSDDGCGSYSPIGDKAKAKQVEFERVEEDDDPEDEGPFTIELWKKFKAFGDTSLSSLVLSTNGVLLLYADGPDGDDPALCCSEDPISLDSDGVDADELVPRIAFLHEDLIALKVYTLDTGKSLIISFEHAVFYADPVDDTLTAQVQVELYYDTGDFDIRWGDLKPSICREDFAARIEDETHNPPVAIPAALGDPSFFLF
jgi:hypothetical protein